MTVVGPRSRVGGVLSCAAFWLVGLSPSFLPPSMALAAAATAPPASGVPASTSPPQPPSVEAGATTVPPAVAAPLPPPASGVTPVRPTGGDPAGASTAAPEPGGGQPVAAASSPRVIATADAIPYESDHDAVVAAWGVEVTPVAARLPVFALRSTTGCPLPAASQAATVAPDCPPVAVSAFGIRHWVTRGLAIDGAIAVAVGGGRDHGRLLDTYLAAGPMLGAAVLLGNWKHMAVMASPGAGVILFRAAKSVDATYVIDFHANLEAELHFGFWGLPALSLGVRSGVALRIERAVEVTQFTLGPTGATTLAGLVNDLSLRYYF